MTCFWQKNKLLTLVIILFFFAFFIYFALWQDPKKDFKFVMLDVGQGDAIFIESPSGKQILIDAGKPRKVVPRLMRYMSPFDRSIDILLLTNPDEDHIGGFLGVLDTYKVSLLIEPGTYNDSTAYERLQKKTKEIAVQKLLARRGMQVDLGDGVLLEVLFPDRDVSNWPTNDGSLVAKVTYEDFSILLTGDATLQTEKIILNNETAEKLQSDFLKVGHHGSNTSTSYKFLETVKPKYALISSGKENPYGHPHQEVLDDLQYLGINLLRTDTVGDIVITCDKIRGCKINK